MPSRIFSWGKRLCNITTKKTRDNWIDSAEDLNLGHFGTVGPSKKLWCKGHIPPKNQTFKNHCLQYQVGKSGQNRNLFVILPPHPTQQQKKRTTHGYHWIHSPSLTWNLNMMVSERKSLFQGAIFRFYVKCCLSIYLISSQGANNVFPVPGGPANNPPRGTRAPGQISPKRPMGK